MAKRLLDILLSLIAMCVCSPLFVLVPVAIVVSSPGPVFYKALRIGHKRRPFVMYKFRSMRVDQGKHRSAITAKDDVRVFALGALLRKSKVDELPQLWNVLKGDMSIVGPRPEDPGIVAKYYRESDNEIFDVLPGLASPTSLYDYTHGEKWIGMESAEEDYIEKFLPIKLSLDLYYVRNASLRYDLELISRSIWVIVCTILGRKRFPPPPELVEVRRLGLIVPLLADKGG